MKLKDKKIELLAQVTERDNEGFATTTLQPVCPPVWAYFRQLSGSFPARKCSRRRLQITGKKCFSRSITEPI